VRKINLKSKTVVDIEAKRKHSSRVSMLGGLMVLLLTLLVYGGVFYLKNQQVNQIKKVKQNITALKTSLDSDKNLKELYDFQGRLIDLKNIISKKIRQGDVLNKVASKTLTTAKVKEVKISVSAGVSTVAVKTNLNDLGAIAKQLELYDQVNAPEQASLKGGVLKDGGLDTAVEFTISKNNSQNNNTIKK
jgi:hypothetical protein